MRSFLQRDVAQPDEKVEVLNQSYLPVAQAFSKSVISRTHSLTHSLSSVSLSVCLSFFLSLSHTFTLRSLSLFLSLTFFIHLSWTHTPLRLFSILSDFLTLYILSHFSSLTLSVSLIFPLFSDLMLSIYPYLILLQSISLSHLKFVCVRLSFVFSQ